MLPRVRVISQEDAPEGEADELTTRKVVPELESEEKRHKIAADVDQVNSEVKLKVGAKIVGNSKSKQSKRSKSRAKKDTYFEGGEEAVDQQPSG